MTPTNRQQDSKVFLLRVIRNRVQSLGKEDWVQASLWEAEILSKNAIRVTLNPTGHVCRRGGENVAVTRLLRPQTGPTTVILIL